MNEVFSFYLRLYILLCSRSVEIVKEYCSSLRNDIDIETEKLIHAVQNYRDEFFNKISEYEKECVSNIEANKNQNKEVEKFINEMNSFCTQW